MDIEVILRGQKRMANIIDFKENDSVAFQALIKSAKLGTAKNGKDYLDLELSDSSGTIAGKIWDATEDMRITYASGIVVSVSGRISAYNGKLQINFDQILPTGEDPFAFAESAPVDINSLVSEIKETLDGVRNETWKTITKSLLNKFSKQFMTYPAALKVHHAYIGGLAFHTTTMLRKAKLLAPEYPFINQDLLYCGVILHDVGKTLEMPGIFGDQYTTEGELLGHIELILEELTAICIKLDIDRTSEDVLLLKHMIASHHGTLEWGAIAVPHIPEAQLLHTIDQLDAQMEQYRKIYETLEPGTWTPDRKYFLGNARVYRPSDNP
jgi:3'-5' exoribonuclease